MDCIVTLLGNYSTRFTREISVRHRQSADGDCGEESTRHECHDASRESATQCEDHLEETDDSRHVAAAVAIAGPVDEFAASNVPHRATKPRLRDRPARAKKNSHRAIVPAAMTAVSKPNNIPARLAIMTMLKCAAPSMESPRIARRRKVGAC